MTLARKHLKPFGIDGAVANFAKFGSRAAGTPVETKDIELIQDLNAWLNGIQSALLSGQTRPLLEDFNALFHVFGYQIAYVLQDGVPEWYSLTTYRVGSIVRKAGTDELYSSLTADNTNNALPNKANNTHWKYLNPVPEPVGRISEYAGDVAPFGYLLCDGSLVDKSQYADLFTVCSHKFNNGVDPGSNKFRLPDLRGRAPIGAGQGTGLTNRAVGQTVGSETHQLTVAELAVHDHDEVGNQSAVFNTQGGGVAQVLAASGTRKTGTSGSGTPHNNMQPSIVLNFIIKH